MEKTMTLNLRVSPTIKKQAEEILKQLGIPMATAVDMYLRQIIMTGGIPFSLSLPKPPAALSMDAMTDEQFHAALQAGGMKSKMGILWPLPPNLHSSGKHMDEIVLHKDLLSCSYKHVTNYS